MFSIGGITKGFEAVSGEWRAAGVYKGEEEADKAKVVGGRGEEGGEEYYKDKSGTPA